MMTVELIGHTVNPDGLCGIAAAECTGGKAHAEKALYMAIRSGHDSVAEHATFTFHINGVSRALLAQLTRHRIASYSVRSQRYCNESYSDKIIPETIAKSEYADRYARALMEIDALYKDMVNDGIPLEDARYILPNAETTSLIMTMNARELAHFFSLRCCNRAQWEIRQLADKMLAQCKEVAPALFAQAGPPCIRHACQEQKPCGNPRASEGHFYDEED